MIELDMEIDDFFEVKCSKRIFDYIDKWALHYNGQSYDEVYALDDSIGDWDRDLIDCSDGIYAFYF